MIVSFPLVLTVLYTSPSTIKLTLNADFSQEERINANVKIRVNANRSDKTFFIFSLRKIKKGEILWIDSIVVKTIIA